MLNEPEYLADDWRALAQPDLLDIFFEDLM